MPEDNSQSQNSPQAIASEDRLLFQVADGLHALAQPLTVLRSALVSLKMGAPEPDRNWYIETSAEQVEHASRIFMMLQDLLFAGSHDAEGKPVDVAELIQGAAAADRQALEKAKVELQITNEQKCRPALGDKDRTLEALMATLEVVISISAPEDRVELFAEEWDKWIKLTFRNARATGLSLTSFMRLKLALAEAKIRSQSGKFEVTIEPLSIAILLPLYEPATA